MENNYFIKDIEKYSILIGDKKTEFRYSSNKNSTIISCLRKIATQSKDKVAIIDDEVKLTYKSFMQKIDAFSNFLLSQADFERTLPITLILNGNSLRYISIYGVLACGGYYLPLEPDINNIERIVSLIQLAKSKIVITNKEYELTLKEKLPNNLKIVVIEDVNFNNILSDQNNISNVSIDATDPAYIIYTSGSTGEPKGVIVPHKAIINLVNSLYNTFKLIDTDIGISFTSFSFDACGCDIYLYLLNEIPLVCIEKRRKYIHDIKKLNKFCIKNKVSVMFLPTILAEKFVSLNNPVLRILYFGGEKFCKNIVTDYRLFNSYGLTETGILNTIYEVSGCEKELPLGHPILNSGIFILNEENEILPKDEVGEIAIWGPNLALEYANDNKMTKEKFITFAEFSNLRCFKTGDLGYIDQDNLLYFKGRKDKQVKISGYRIELDEIRFYLQQYSDIEISIPLAVKNNEKSILINFYTSKKKIDENLINSYLNKYLPFYMIPLYHIWIKDIPYTTNGKIDYKKLENLFNSKRIEVQIKNKSLLDEEDLKQFLLAIYSQILKIKKEDILENISFFEMGGDSLKSLKLQLMIEDKLGREIDLSYIYHELTVKNILRLLLQYNIKEEI